MAGRNKLPDGEKKVSISPFIEKKIVDKITKKQCEKIAVEAIKSEYEKLK